jgi:bacterioferritin-associated ferredoxin
MYVCICNALNERQVDAAVTGGAKQLAQVFAHHGCAVQCGKCVPELCSRLKAGAPPELVTLGAGAQRAELADAE